MSDIKPGCMKTLDWSVELITYTQVALNQLTLHFSIRTNLVILLYKV